MQFDKRIDGQVADGDVTPPPATCSVCNGSFFVRFRYQVREEAGHFLYFCSQACQQQELSVERACECTVCGQRFALEFPYQVCAADDGKRYYCSTACRQLPAAAAPRAAVPSTAGRSEAPVPATAVPGLGGGGGPTALGPRRFAVFNHKGGTGKTTTSVNLAAGLAETGVRVLLIDADGQGNVGAALGIRGEYSLYHVLMTGRTVAEAAVPVRHNLDVLTSNETLAAVELRLASLPNRARVMRERLGAHLGQYDAVILDCAPALSLMNQNALVCADSIIIPVSCDYLSLVGVRQVLRTMRSVRDELGHRVELLGVLPTFFDVRNRISRDALSALQDHFKERCLPAIRVNTKLREAPSTKQTIFELAPESHGAADYRTLVQYIASRRHGGILDANPGQGTAVNRAQAALGAS